MNQMELNLSTKDLINKFPLIEIFIRSLVKNRLGHAYLIVGCETQELDLVASFISAVVLCQNKSKSIVGQDLYLEPCGQCNSCMMVKCGRHPDIFWIRPSGKLRQIRVDHIRALEEHLNLKGSFSPWRIAIIAEAERMNINAANAFLKTLEEPPPQVIIFLLSIEPERLLATIRSRCLRIDLARTEIRKWSEAQLSWLRDLIDEIFSKRNFVGIYNSLYSLLKHLQSLYLHIEEAMPELSPEEKEAIDKEIAEEIEVQREEAIQAEYRKRRQFFLKVLLWWLRDVWLATRGIDAEKWEVKELADITQSVAKKLESENVRMALIKIEETLSWLDTNVPEANVLELMLLRLYRLLG